MAKSDKLYDKSPRLERGDDGDMEIKKPEQKEGKVQPMDEEEAGSSPYTTDIKNMHDRQHQEMKDMHKRHQKEMNDIAAKHAVSKEHSEKSEKK